MSDLYSDVYTDTYGAALTSVVGINVAGGEFGTGGGFSNTAPGTYDTAYHYDGSATFIYLASRGLDLVRIPFRWERLQPTLGAALDSAELTRLTDAVNRAGAAGLSVVLDVHNYGGYVLSGGEAKIGSASVTQAHFTDLWTRIAAAFKTNPYVTHVGLMNEPNGLAATSGTFTPAATHYNFESTAQGWSAEGTATVVRTTTSPIAGTGSLLANKTMAAGADTIRCNDSSGLADDISANGATLQLKVKARGANVGTATQARIEVQNSSFAWQAGPWFPVTVGTGGTYGAAVTLQYTPAAGLLANCRAVGIQFEGTGLNGSTDVQIDDVQQGTVTGALSAAEVWEQASQAALTAIRTEEGAGAHKTVLVAGYNWSGAQQWTTSHPDPWITDSAANFRYEAHLYFDNDNSGTYAASYATENSNAVGQGYVSVTARATAHLAVFTGWLNSYGVQGFVGEVGWPDDSGWNAVGSAVYAGLAASSLPSTYWATGEWWGTSYALAAYEQTGTAVDTANGQAAVIEAYIASTPTPTGPAEPAPTRLGALWSRAGDWTGPLEDLSTGGVLAKRTAVVATWGRAEPRATSDAAAGKLTFALNNHGRQFSPENTASPIAGRALTGTPARLQVTDPSSGAVTTVFQGPIGSLSVDSQARTVDVEVFDGWGKPGDTKLSTAVYQGKRTGELITVVLDAIGWPAGNRSIDPGVTVVPYWWVEGTDAKTAVTDLVHSDGPPAVAWVQNGTFCFRDRHHRVTQDTSLTSRGEYTHIIPAGAIGTDHKIVKDSFVYNHGLDHIVNSATLEITPRKPSARTVVWEIEDAIVISAGESRTYVIRTDDPVIGLQVPSPGLTYLEDGTVLTADYRVTQGSVASITLSRTSGQSAYLTITAGGGPGGPALAFGTGINVRGTPLLETATQIVSAGDPNSQATYGNADWDWSAPWAGIHDARALVDRAVGIYSLPQPSVTLDVEGRFGPGTLTRILGTAISDRITVREDEIGLDADFHIEQVGHTVTRLGLTHRCSIGAQIVEPYQAALPFQFDTAGAGFGQGQFSMNSGHNPATMFRFDTTTPAAHGFGPGVFAT